MAICSRRSAHQTMGDEKRVLAKIYGDIVAKAAMALGDAEAGLRTSRTSCNIEHKHRLDPPRSSALGTSAETQHDGFGRANTQKRFNATRLRSAAMYSRHMIPTNLSCCGSGCAAGYGDKHSSQITKHSNIRWRWVPPA